MRLAYFAPSSVSSRKKNCWTVIFMEDCRIISWRINEIKPNGSRFVTSTLLSNFPANLLGQ